MDFATFHRALVGTDPTPKQLAIYQNLNLHHGDLRGLPDKEEFLATFLAAICLTVDPATQQYRYVHLLMPTSLEDWATDVINRLLEVLRKKKLSPVERTKRNRGLVKAMNHVLRGGRIWSLPKAPDVWVAFGFTTETPIPEWLKSGLTT